MQRVELPLAAQGIDTVGLKTALAKTVTGEVCFDRLSRALYSTDASVYQIVPQGVVFPRTEADVLATLAACRQFSVPLTSRGGGTSQAGQPIGAGVILECSRHFGEILEVNAEQRWARVRPGCVLDELNQRVRPLGLQFAPDISTSNRATIGGMVANNSSGTHSVIHGKTIDHVLELKVALADGTILHLRQQSMAEWEACCQRPGREGDCFRAVQRLARLHHDEILRRYPRILRRVGGYNLDRFITAPGESRSYNLSDLLVGSEGTLAVTLEAKLRLIELPSARAVLVVQFADLLAALAATPFILEHQPAAVELIDKYILDSTHLNPEASRLRGFLQGDPASILIVEFYADRAEDLAGRLEKLEEDLRRRGLGYHYHRSTDAAGQSRIWKLRKAALGLSMAEKGDAKAISFVEDTAVDPAKLRDYIAELTALIARHGTRAGIYAHASVGCLHVRPVIDLKTETGLHQFEAIAGETAELVLKYGGALSGEHGDGLVRSPFQEKMYGPALYEAFREIKKTFDPQGLLNPSKIVDAPPLTANLRFRPGYVTPEPETIFDFTVEGGLTRAAELCGGVGECRKKREGTMCPSYQATGAEQHSTRGRANALRLALTGQLGFSGLTDPALHEALDLCLECKACKSECPTNVDMARLKAEFLYQYSRKHGLSWRSWLFGHVADLGRWGSRLAPLSNWLAGGRLGRWLNDKLLGIDCRRRPPAFARQTFASRHAAARASSPAETGAGKPVLFIPDTFVNYHEPELGMATVELLTRVGCRVRVALPPEGPALRCCGRPMISNGLLDQAVAHARYNVERLYPLAATHAMVACEPSCVLTLKDDYPALLRGEERRRAEAVAAACVTLEELLERLPGCRPEAFQPVAGKVLVQGHCHQRSLVGMEPTLRLLRRIPGAEVVDLDAGCCGMAGSFGYEKEHYEVSRLVGEQRLFPALRQASVDSLVVAAGFSCRMQIAHFTDRQVFHPAMLLRQLVQAF